MDFIRNFPFFSIMLCMFSAIVSSVLSGKMARRITRIVLLIIMAMSVALLAYLIGTGESYVYYMGHFPAPWGNELRAGILEALMALFFSTIALFAVTGGMKAIFSDIEASKVNLYFILVDLIVASLLAMAYTNDLFTAYVFIEINTIAGCGLIMVRQIGKTTVTAVRYMITSLLGSGLFLIGVTMLYTVTGHLLMSNIKESVAELIKNEEYMLPLTVIVGLMTVGLAIKSGLYPFHIWIPDAYGNSNVASSALLSSVVSKGYIFLLIKIFYRVIGMDVIVSSKVINIIFVFGIAGIIMGSVMAIAEHSLRKIIAYSSVAQIGYIYMGIGLGTTAGVVAAIFHIFSHGATKALLFIASSEFTEGSHSKRLEDITGLGRRFKTSSLIFSIGALSMVGFPFLSGFISKLLFSSAAVGHRHKMFIAIFALAVSTILNAVYFLRIVVNLYTTKHMWKKKKSPAVNGAGAGEDGEAAPRIDDMDEKNAEFKPGWQYFAAIIGLTIINFILGMFSQPIINMIEQGLSMFA